MFHHNPSFQQTYNWILTSPLDVTTFTCCVLISDGPNPSLHKINQICSKNESDAVFHALSACSKFYMPKITHIIYVTYQLPPRGTDLLEKLRVDQLVQKLPVFYETQKLCYWDHKMVRTNFILSQLTPNHPIFFQDYSYMHISHLIVWLKVPLF